MKKSIVLILLLFSLGVSAIAQNESDIKTIGPLEFKEAISGLGTDVQLIDVRTEDEFNEGHIENALNIDFFKKENFVKTFNKLDKEKPVYLYCRSGNRSHKSALLLTEMGFKKIYDLKGGFMSWQ